jgi:hypothetical protein
MTRGWGEGHDAADHMTRDQAARRAARTLVSGRSGLVGVVLHVRPHLLLSDSHVAHVQRADIMLWLGSPTKTETLDHIL